MHPAGTGSGEYPLPDQLKLPVEIALQRLTVDLVRRARREVWGDNSGMAVGDRSAQEPTPVFDAVLASVQAAVQAQTQAESEGHDTDQAEVAAAV
jgi:hypothetical protein